MKHDNFSWVQSYKLPSDLDGNCSEKHFNQAPRLQKNARLRFGSSICEQHTAAKMREFMRLPEKKQPIMKTTNLSSLPDYTGITGVERTGWPVDQCAEFIARLAGVKLRCVEIAAARMTGIPEWEVKAALGRWMWEDATQYRDLEKRLTELRSSRSAIRKILDFQLGDFLIELLHTPNTQTLLAGWFGVLSPAFCAAIRRYLAGTQPLVDQPTVRVLKSILAEEEERLETGEKMLAVLSTGQKGEECADWRTHLAGFLDAAGGILGNEPIPERGSRPKPRATEEYRMDREFRRDGRFQTTIPKQIPVEVEKNTLQTMMWIRAQEMTAAELMASVLHEWHDLPTDAIVDLSRHCWDEVRHALFGCCALAAEGIAHHSLLSWVGYAHHTLPAPPQKRYSHLAIATEAGAMAYPGGKRGEWEFCRDVAEQPLMTTFQDFDWADEVTHVNYGRKWLVEYFCKGNRELARQMADETVAERIKYYEQFAKEGAHSGKAFTGGY